MDLVIKSPEGETKLSLVASLRPGDIPLSYLKLLSAWKPFWCAPDQQFPSSPVIVKISRVGKEANAKSYMGICEYVKNGLWMLGRLSSTIRVKDVKMLASVSDAPLSRHEIQLSNMIQSWSLEPNWEVKDCGMKLNMKPKEDKQLSPADELKSRYLATLYSHAPLSYFAKSTLSRHRAICRAQSESNDKTRYLEILSSSLRSLVIDFSILDNKYAHKLVDEEQARYDSFITNIPQSKIKSTHDSLKIREVQLQIIILLELMATSDSGDQQPTVKAPPKPSRPALVRRKKSQKQSDIKDSSPAQSLSYSTQADILFDRLCIHQAVDGQINIPPNTNDNKPLDRILEFCMEVILPFYGNRVPTFAKSMVKKAKGLATKWVPPARSTTKAKSVEEPSKTSISEENVQLGLRVLKSMPSPAARTKSTNSLVNNQKRQVELISSFSSIREETIQAELAQAIKNASKPNRAATLGISGLMSNTTKTVARADVQVTMTPMKKKRFTQLQEVVTPVKRPRFDEITSSPIESIETDDDGEGHD